MTETTTETPESPAPRGDIRERFDLVYEAIDKVVDHAATLGIKDGEELILLFGGGIIRVVASLPLNSPVRAAAAKAVEHLVGQLSHTAATVEKTPDEEADAIEEEAAEQGKARGMDARRIKVAKRRVEAAARTLRYIGSVEGVDDDGGARAMVLAGAMAMLYKHCPIEETPKMREIAEGMTGSFDEIDKTNRILQQAAEQFSEVAEQLWSDLIKSSEGEKKDSETSAPPAAS